MERKESTIIDLSDTTSISDLVAKISSALDSEEYVNQNLFLNIGKVSLKQSQLLSIKALIEAMNSTLDGIQTESEMTEASAISLGISTKAPVQNLMPTFQEAFKNINKTEPQATEEAEFSSFAQLKKANSIGDFVTDTSAIPEAEEVKEDETLEEETQEFLQEVEAEDEAETSEEPESEEEENRIKNLITKYKEERERKREERREARRIAQEEEEKSLPKQWHASAE